MSKKKTDINITNYIIGLIDKAYIFTGEIKKVEEKLFSEWIGEKVFRDKVIKLEVWREFILNNLKKY